MEKAFLLLAVVAVCSLATCCFVVWMCGRTVADLLKKYHEIGKQMALVQRAETFEDAVAVFEEPLPIEDEKEPQMVPLEQAVRAGHEIRDTIFHRV